MKKIALALMMVVFLYGCSTTKPVKPEVPVWVPPTIALPQRPKLISDGLGTDGEVARKATIDLYSMEEYALKLENVCVPLQGASGVVPTPSAVSK